MFKVGQKVLILKDFYKMLKPGNIAIISRVSPIGVTVIKDKMHFTMLEDEIVSIENLSELEKICCNVE